MIKNPTIDQPVYFIENGEIRQSFVSYCDNIRIVTESDSILRIDEIFPTEKLAYEKALKSLNKEILELSKRREKLASKLAKLLG